MSVETQMLETISHIKKTPKFMSHLALYMDSPHPRDPAMMLGPGFSFPTRKKDTDGDASLRLDLKLKTLFILTSPLDL